MTIERMEWHPNDSILSSWTMIAGMTLEWKNDTQMLEWHSNDWMTPEWWFEVKMSKELWDDKRMIKWHSNEINDMGWMKSHPNDSILSTWTMVDGMTLEWQNDIRVKNTFKWQDDIQMVDGMVEWHSNDGMTPEWCFKVEMS